MSKLTQYAGKGQEQIQDTKTAYLKIAQTIRDETIKQKPNYIPGLEAGQFFCSTTKKIYGNEVDVIVLSTRKNYMLVDLQDNFQGFADKIEPTWQRDVDGRLRTPEGLIARVQYSFLVVTPDNLDEPMVLTMKKSDVPAARDWNTMIKNAKLEDGKSPAPIFGCVWTLSTVFREGEKGNWFSLTTGKASSIKFKSYISDDIVDNVVALFDHTSALLLAAPAEEESKALPMAEEKDM